MKNLYPILIFLFAGVHVFGQSRVADGLLDLYTFAEGDGDFVHDVSGVGFPSVLEIEDPSKVEWQAGGGIRFVQPTIIRSLYQAQDIYNAVSASNEVTLEAWVKPTNNSQSGPARIVTMSHGTSEANLMLTQNNSAYGVRMRTASTDLAGNPMLSTASGSTSNSQIQHVVYTRSANGAEKMYIDGVQVKTGTRSGDCSNWYDNYRLAIGNEIDADRPWLGTVYLVAAYGRALSANEVAENHAAGAFHGGGNASAESCPQSNCFIDGYGSTFRSLWLPSLPNGVLENFEFDADGGHFDVFEDGTAHMYGNCVNIANPDYGFYMHFWFTDRMNWTEWSALGRNWKGTSSIVGNLYTTWDYYIMDGDKENVLIGTGNYDGSLLNVTHRPADYTYGLQIGLAANDKNQEPGMSCWFDYSGTINGNAVSNHGDINLEGGCEDLPVLNCAVDITVDCEDGGFDPVVTGSPLIYCEQSFDLSYADTMIADDCPVTIIRTWTATDINGNQATCTQNITVVDEVAPVIFNAPADVTVECGQIPEPSIDFEDGCFTNDVSMSVADVEFSGACQPTVQRTYTLTDPCGNVTTHIQYITVIDTQAPVFTNAPANLVLQCGDAFPTADVQATDNCGEPTVVFNEVSSALDCGQLIVRTWTASDLCGNSEVLVQEILVEDNEGPAADNTPANAAVSCDAIPAMAEVTFTDACSVVASVVSNESVIGSGCEYELVRTWTASDVCGNTTIVTQTIHVSDNEAPVFELVPEDIVVDCGTDVPVQSPVVADQCGAVSLNLIEVWIDDVEYCAVLQRTWTATDACGNTSVASQLVTWVDAEGPVFSGVPSDGVASCNDIDVAPTVTATDACEGSVPVFMDEVLSVQGCVISIVRTWTATDMCGNVSTATQTLTANDTSAPVITGAPVLSIECSDSNNESLVSVADDCLFAVELTFADVFVGAGAAVCQETYERTYTATDICGNTATFVQLLNIIDQTAPEFTFVPADIAITCGETAELIDAVATDLCSDITVTFEEISLNGECGDELQRVWTATDDCGNTSIATQIVSYVDDVSPVITGVPASITLNCSDAIPSAPQVSVTDNCDVAVMLVYNQTTYPGSCPNNYQIIRSWSATDACGNVGVQSQIITVSDNEAPVFDYIPQDETADCGNLPEPAVLTATDNCSEVSISYSQNVGSGGCPNIFRTWVATDACGNTATVTQTIFVEDNEPPLLTGIPSNTQVSCNSIPDMPTPDVSDNCDDNVAITMNESIVGSGCFYTIIRTWIASDDCGNTTIVSQSIQVEDTEAPIFVNVPAEMTVECANVGALPLPQVIDDCGNSVSIISEDVIMGMGCTYDIERTYTATDLCGHSAQATMIIHVIDTTPPVITGVGPNTFVSCNNIPSPNNAVAVDACGGQTSLSVVDTQIGTGCSYIISRTYNALDACGNGASLTQLIYVQDNTAPVFIGVPDNVVIGCNDPIPGVAQVGALDNCSGAPQVNFFQFSEENGCSQIITRVWTATDACGNQATATRTITVTDNVAPEFTFVPANTTAECGAIPAVEMATATDDCSVSVAIEMVEEIIAVGCPFEIRRIFIATDECGNEATAVQSIFVNDNVAPTLSFYPADEAVTCETFTEAPAVQAIDNCSGVAVVLEEIWGAPGCIQSLTRIWTATDNCGNAVQHTQLVTITDVGSPVFTSAPADMVINCLQVPEMQALVAEDDCNNTLVESFEQIEATDCATEYTIVRNWIATDACGNAATAIQTIVVVDDIAPILVGVPEDLTVDCNNVPEIAEVTALESCGEVIDVVFNESETGAAETSMCEVGNSPGFSGDMALWLTGADVIAGNYVYGPDGGSFWVDPVTNEAHLVGQVYNTLNANFSWMIDVTLGEERTWEEWSALGRDYKDDLGIATNDYQDWMFYILNGNSSRLIGMGAFEGNELNLTHAPADSTFGFQLGMNANNHSAGYGLGGWFFYNGVFGGEPVNGHGDFFTINYCCEERDIIRTWTATDCAGNTTTFSQTIHVVNQPPTDPNMLIFPTIEAMDFDVTGTDSDQFIISFTPDYSGRANIEVFDSRGQCVGIVGQLEVIEGASYSLRYPKTQLTKGAYIFTLSGNKKIVSDTEMVLR
ncbi:MAG: hypothetical protein GC193_04705 [Cryomorphaceae bacterium]|nr:hypothetical protein [Cryomorphaceae bacterium]